MIRIGTAGFAYDDWVGPVYPQGLVAGEQLSFYAREFSTVEINTTFYRTPEQHTVAGWVRKTPAGFLFSVKAFRGLTHERESPDYAGFSSSLSPLVESGKLGCVLAQFPYSFHATPANRDALRELRDGLAGLPLVVELRNSGWVNEQTMELLRSLEVGFCCVDEPRLPGLMPPVAEATGPVAYVRFHGRNAAKWYNHKEPWERYDYTYTLKELMEWVPRLDKLESTAPLTLVYFNNHFAGQAIRGARDLGQLLLDMA